MGCDIHMYMEWRQGDGPWQIAPCHPKEEENQDDDVRDRWSDFVAAGRNYNVFGALAGVRRDGPSPKGLPDDVSPEVHSEVDSWNDDGHSHSWCTLEELEKALLDCEYENHGRAQPMTYRRNSEAGAFYDSYMYTDYFDVVNYARKFLLDTAMEQAVFADQPQSVEIRFVFWFDN
jgi:hypothetical protein